MLVMTQDGWQAQNSGTAMGCISVGRNFSHVGIADVPMPRYTAWALGEVYQGVVERSRHMPAAAVPYSTKRPYPLVGIWLLLYHRRHVSHCRLNDHLQAAHKVCSMQLTQQPVRLYIRTQHDTAQHSMTQQHTFRPRAKLRSMHAGVAHMPGQEWYCLSDSQQTWDLLLNINCKL
jgi:hypothetical protein